MARKPTQIQPAKMGKRAARKIATRERLANVAREAFRRDGYDGITFRRLSAEAECSTGAYFSGWPTKDALYAEVMGRPAPNVIAFLERVAVKCAGEPISKEALALRRDLIGEG